MKRVMWLLNHRTARKFEIPMLKKIGISEIFLPKIYPSSISFRSADVDDSEDKNLTIPADDLAVLNQTNWYEEVPKSVWNIANRYFDGLFFIAHSRTAFKNVRHFNGAIIWRAYGLSENCTYTKLFEEFSKGLLSVKSMGPNFWFGQAYDHLHEIESPELQSRKLLLPLGLNPCNIQNQWEGNNRQLFFICPDQGFNPYYQDVYNTFCENFGDFPFVCGGAQPIPIRDTRVQGFLSNDKYEYNFKQLRVMFYHSTETRHIHYHPFEAIRAGMPLLFMGGGMLDKMGGRDLPGRCSTIQEARDKVRRILNDDWDLIDSIRQTQGCLLESMRLENCEQAWRDGLAQVRQKQGEKRNLQAMKIIPRKKRIAIILPVGYRGGTLQGTQLLAEALWKGSRECGEDAEIVFAHLNDDTTYSEDEFAHLPNYIQRRVYNWKTLDSQAAKRAMTYAGYHDWKPVFSKYIAPDDGIQQFIDCDLWVIVSDRLSLPLLPIRPSILMIYDYAQRYISVNDRDDQPFLNATKYAERIIVTTHFTEQDALQYAGLDPRNVFKLPMLLPVFDVPPISRAQNTRPYFIWTTNLALHKNHLNAFKALAIYYEELEGCLDCHVTGVDTHLLIKSEFAHTKLIKQMVENSKMLQEHVHLLGEMPIPSYRRELANAVFLWHPAIIDNGTFTVLEAARCKVPALSSDYPSIQEMNIQFNLNLTWMKADNPRHMAQQLKWMENNSNQQKHLLQEKEQFIEQHNTNAASQYWEVVKACL